MAQAATAMQQGQPAQNLENHARFVPMFHFYALPVLGLNVIYSIYHAIRHFSGGAVVGLLVSVALVAAALYGRVFALSVQDRVIRLEMRVRLGALLPPDLRARINEFSVNQLIALRFASDAELPELARKVLEGNIQGRKEIKQMIRDWQPDYLRA